MGGVSSLAALGLSVGATVGATVGDLASTTLASTIATIEGVGNVVPGMLKIKDYYNQERSFAFITIPGVVGFKNICSFSDVNDSILVASSNGYLCKL